MGNGIKFPSVQRVRGLHGGTVVSPGVVAAPKIIDFTRKYGFAVKKTIGAVSLRFLVALHGMRYVFPFERRCLFDFALRNRLETVDSNLNRVQRVRGPFER